MFIHTHGAPPSKAESMAYRILAKKYPGKDITFTGSGQHYKALDFKVEDVDVMYECKRLIGRTIWFTSEEQLRRLIAAGRLILFSQLYKYIGTVNGNELMEWVEKNSYRIHIDYRNRRPMKRLGGICG